MHGVPPNDFPRQELAEFFKLHSMVEGMGPAVSEEIRARYSILDENVRNWPRNAQNDPFHYASNKLAAKLAEVSGCEVLVGYNEFCAPCIEEALQSAVDKGIGKIIVATTMMTRGGEHAEKDIPAGIEAFTKKHPDVEIVYAWPFAEDQVARFLNDHIAQFIR
jgi:sirohydrochlorin cobaltochelatase